MKSLFRAAMVLSISSMLLTSCFVRVNKNALELLSSSGEVETTVYDWTDVNNIEANSADVEYYQSESDCRVEVIADKVYDGRYTITCENGNLRLKVNSISTPFKDLKFVLKVYSPSLSGVSYAGSGDVIFCNGLVSDESLNVSLAGSGDIKLGDIKASSVGASLAGSGDVSATKVECGEMEIAIAGSGDIVFAGVEAGNVSVAIAGSGDVKLSGAAQSVDSEISGSGSVNIKDLSTGDEKNLVKGSGKVIK